MRLFASDTVSHVECYCLTCHQCVFGSGNPARTQ